MTPDNPNTISLDTTSKQPISLDTTGQNYLLDEKALDDRSFRAAYGLQGTVAAKDQSDIRASIQSGQENQVREDAATKLTQAATDKRNSIITQAIAAKKGPLSKEDMAYIDGVAPFNTYFDPKSVFETAAANQYTSELDQFAGNLDDSNPWNVAKAVQNQWATNDVDAMKQFGSVIMAKHNYLLTKLQNAASETDQQSWPRYLWEQFKLGVVPFYGQVQERGVVPGSGFFEGGDLGGNLQAQQFRLWDLPFPQFRETTDQIENIFQGHPELKAAFFQSMLGQSTSDRVFNVLNTAADLATVPSVVTFGASVYSKAYLIASIRKAAKDIATANVNPAQTKADILASVGNLPASAVEGATKQVTDNISGVTNRTQDALEQLPRYFRVDEKNLVNDASASENLRNTIIQQYQASQSRILRALATVLRPQTIPLQNATRAFLDELQKTTWNRYPSLSNSWIKFIDPQIEPISNQIFQTGWLGRKAGEYFDTEWEAANYAKMHGFRVTLSTDQLANLDAKIAEVQRELKPGMIDIARPPMDADVHGLNQYYSLDNQLKDLQQYREEFSKPGGYNVGQQGLGYYVEVTQPLQHTSKLIRDFVFNPDRETSISPSSWLNFIPYGSAAQRFRTAEDTLSAEQNAIRKATLYPQSVMMAVAHEEGKSLKALTRGERKTLSEVLKYLQNEPDRIDGREGYYFRDISELNNHYLSVYDRLPSDAETQAFFAIKRWAEYDRVLRELGLYRYKSRLGAETHQITVKSPDGTDLQSDKFDGVKRSTLPGGRGNLLLIGDDSNDATIFNLGRTADARKEKLRELLEKQGYKIVELFDPERRPFKDFVKGGENNIQFVMTKGLQTSPLSWEQVPRTGGGHMVYDYDWFIKQANIQSERAGGVLTHRYEGDTTLHAVPFKSMGDDFVRKLNAIKNLIRDNKGDEAKALFERTNLPYKWSEFRGFFNPVTDANGIKQPPRFNLNEDFQVVPRNLSIIQMDPKAIENRYTNPLSKFVRKGIFVDGTREGSLARNFQIEYTGQRDAKGLMSLANNGTVENPIYNLAPAQKVDPIHVMTRGLGSIIRHTFMDEYKTAAVEAWLREVSPHVDVKDSELRSSPFFWFNNIDKNVFTKGTRSLNPEFVDTMMANKFKINQLVGAPSWSDTLLHSWAQKLADASYGTFGKSLIPQWLLHKTHDPFAFMRSVTFNAYLGMFSIPQLFVQMATYANIFGLTPRYAVTGTYAAMLHGLSRLNSNPEIIEHLDSLATKLSIPGMPAWKAGEFKEAMQAVDKTGFLNVAGEYGPLSTFNKASVFNGPGSTFLKWGQAPFRGGERATRIGAWYTAFKEYRDLHPTGAIGRQELQDILQRADLLYGNMSSASNSVLHTGFMSTMAQFYAYNIRLAEMFFSKRIGATPMERMLTRARLVAFNSALFGVPMSLGISGFPVGDYLRQEMLENSNTDSWYNPMKWARKITGTEDPYEVGKNWISTLLMEGIPSVMLAWITGKYYDVGQRYGLQGFTQIRNALNGDSKWWELIGGASASLSMNTWANLGGFTQAMGSLIRGDGKIPLTMDDIIDAGREITSVNRGSSTAIALLTGKWVSKNYAKVADNVSAWQALGMFVSGLNPQNQVDARNVSVNLKSQQDSQKTAQKLFEKTMNKQLLAVQAGDDALADTLYRKAAAFLELAGVPPDKIAESISKFASHADDTVVNKSYWNRYVKNPPAGFEDQYLQIYQNQYKQNEGK